MHILLKRNLNIFIARCAQLSAVTEGKVRKAPLHHHHTPSTGGVVVVHRGLYYFTKVFYKGGQLYPFGNQFQARENILESYKTLTDKNMMGARFKVLRSSQIEC